MTRTKSTYLALLAVLLSPMAANADLILNITNSGSGNTLWEMTGSTTAIGDQSSANGFWPQFEGLTAVNTSLGCINIVSGSGTLSTTTSGTRNLNDACVYANSGASDYITPRTSSAFAWSIGDTLTWSGNMVVAAAYSVFNPGTYVTQQSIYQGAVPQFSRVVVNIGPVSVPEPGTLALFGIGLFGVGLTRRRKKA